MNKKVLGISFIVIGVVMVLLGVSIMVNAAPIPDKIVVANSKEDGEVYIVGNTLKYVDNTQYKFGQLVFNIGNDKFSMAFVSKCAIDKERYANYMPSVVVYKGKLVDMLNSGNGEDLWMALILQRTTEIACGEKLTHIKLISYKEAQDLSFKYTTESLFSEK